VKIWIEKHLILDCCRASLILAALLLSMYLPVYAHAAGSGDSGSYSSTAAASSSLKEAKKAIADERFGDAYDLLAAEVQVDADNADIHNLLGYAARKMGNLAESEAHYFKALSLDPKHKGALEYMGELYLTLNRPDEARKLLEKLESICWLGCDEKDELKAAIAKWEEANG
jgi:tetratricopeptide (TPR) repeat protein